jgi:NhaP-type Na+/H+ or K+/H+ antiporter
VSRIGSGEGDGVAVLSQGDIMLAAALVFGLATACQVIAPILRIPALILLLPVGFTFGLVAPQFQADRILGPAFPVMVDLMVAVILFQGGVELGATSLDRVDKRVVNRLVWIGGAITCAGGTLAAFFLLGLSWQLAFLLGAILIVSGPTVVTPILDFARPKQRVRGILLWEGTTLDPLGAIFAVVVFQLVQASTSANGPLEAVGSFFLSLLIAVVVAIGGTLLIAFGSKLTGGKGMLSTQLLIGSVLASAGLANFLAEESGLLTALLMGIAAPRLAERLDTTIEPAQPFFNTIASIGIGVLFISIAAIVPSPIVASIALPAVAMALILIVVVRPIVVLFCTGRAKLTRQERGFIAWMDPRGIVAAATASSLGASLVTARVPGAEKLLPAAFMIIAVTVFVYGLTAVPVARLLGVREPLDAE